MTLTEFLDFFDFDYEKDENGYTLIDKQGAYYGNIGNERFKSLPEVIERFVNSIYHMDYIETDLEEEFGYDGDYSTEDELQFAEQNNIGYACILRAMVHPETVTE